MSKPIAASVWRQARRVGCLSGVLLLVSRGVVGEPTHRGEWPTYGADLAQTRYAPLDQIDASNFSSLEVAWRFKVDNLGPQPEFNLQSTPLMVDGVLYSTGGTRRAVVALDAGTGELRWMFSLQEGKRAEVAPRRLSGRGLAYWSDGQRARILYVTHGYQLVALDAKTGQPAADFGVDGVVDLKRDMDQDVDPVTADVGLHASPIVALDTVIVGAAHRASSSPKNRGTVKGLVRGYDVRTGKRLWVFNTIPRPGEYGNETWLEDSWRYTGNTGVWSQIAADEELGLAYLPVEMPTNDYYGGHRPGNTLFSESVVAVDLKTGERRWHYQIVRHGMWDGDLPCAPVLADITVNGRRIKALAQPTKHGFVFVFDRATGEPVWPIEDRPVPKGDVPREWYAATQPFPTKPPPFERQGVTIDDLIDFTPELREEAVRLVSRYKLGPLFTPPVVSRKEGPLATLMLPSGAGGANWPGASYDPETGVLYIFSLTEIHPLGLVPGQPGTGVNFIRGFAEPNAGAPSVRGLPLVKPPYGRITAIDLNKGDVVWQIAHGETPDAIRNHPALKGLTIPRTGTPGLSARIGTLVTKTLVIAGDSGVFTTAGGVRGAMLRAYDKKSGKEVGAVYMPAEQTGSPMTYMHNGRQYLVVAIGGSDYSGELRAYRVVD